MDIPRDLVYIVDTDQLAAEGLACGAVELWSAIEGLFEGCCASNNGDEPSDILVAKIAVGPCCSRGCSGREGCEDISPLRAGCGVTRTKGEDEFAFPICPRRRDVESNEGGDICGGAGLLYHAAWDIKGYCASPDVVKGCDSGEEGGGSRRLLERRGSSEGGGSGKDGSSNSSGELHVDSRLDEMIEKRLLKGEIANGFKGIL